MKTIHCAHIQRAFDVALHAQLADLDVTACHAKINCERFYVSGFANKAFGHVRTFSLSVCDKDESLFKLFFFFAVAKRFF